MRGNEQVQEEIFSYITPAQRVPESHPLRPIRKMVDNALQQLSPEFDAMYAEAGRPSIPPEQLLRALLLQLLWHLSIKLCWRVASLRSLKARLKDRVELIEYGIDSMIRRSPLSILEG